MVRGLVDDQGVRHEDQVTMSQMVKEYFSNLFTSERPRVDGAVLGGCGQESNTRDESIVKCPFLKRKSSESSFQHWGFKSSGTRWPPCYFLSGFWNVLETVGVVTPGYLKAPIR